MQLFSVYASAVALVKDFAPRHMDTGIDPWHQDCMNIVRAHSLLLPTLVPMVG
jgi:hypothetical protein